MVDGQFLVCEVSVASFAAAHAKWLIHVNHRPRDYRHLSTQLNSTRLSLLLILNCFVLTSTRTSLLFASNPPLVSCPAPGLSISNCGCLWAARARGKNSDKSNYRALILCDRYERVGSSRLRLKGKDGNYRLGNLTTGVLYVFCLFSILWRFARRYIFVVNYRQRTRNFMF